MPLGVEKVAKSASLSKGARRVQRALEVAPRALTWTILIAPVAASFLFVPYIAVAIFLIDIYWFVRTATVVVGIRSIYRKLKAAMLQFSWPPCLPLAVSAGPHDPLRQVLGVLIPSYTRHCV